jgi:hypothetical protein
MNMKLAITKKTSSRIFNRAPIKFWEAEKVEEDSTTKNFYKIVLAMRSNMILLIKRVTHTKVYQTFLSQYS